MELLQCSVLEIFFFLLVYTDMNETLLYKFQHRQNGGQRL